MITFICLFFPAVLSVWLYEKLKKAELSPKKWAYRYALNTVLINFACFLTKSVVLNTAALPLYTADVDMYPSAALNYLIMALVAMVVITFVEIFTEKSAKITIEDEADAEKE